ncbi:hypothetical protein Y032_0445g1586 [Ancylostoma ceylanicum]|uniref:SCP domain-containing protein n=1 Tax=Ancylostoma ceylanicum TaxID=53326 RepID=A0A016WZ45_9BILA|nr:hypothetical protein Y032_0445g1586 [Ancylostoma ceylanicum]
MSDVADQTDDSNYHSLHSLPSNVLKRFFVNKVKSSTANPKTTTTTAPTTSTSTPTSSSAAPTPPSTSSTAIPSPTASSTSATSPTVASSPESTTSTTITSSSTVKPTSTTTRSTTTRPPSTTRKTPRPPWPKPSCGNKRLTNGLRSLFLNTHNRLRGRLARGQTEISRGWGIAPPAALMYRMKYSCEAESYAQQQVTNCIRRPLPEYTHPGYKLNLHVLNTVQTTFEGAIQNALSRWWSQLSRFGMRSDMKFVPRECQGGNRNVLSWTKMAWWNNKHLGCAVQRCRGFFLTACMYSPGGNQAYHHVYKVGAVCSQCPKGQCDGEALCRW